MTRPAKGYIHATHEVEALDGETIIGSTELRIHYVYRPGDSGCMYERNGDPGWPPEPAEIELDRVEMEDGKRWVATDDHFEWAESYLEKHHDEVERDVAERDEAAREYAAEMRRDA